MKETVDVGMRHMNIDRKIMQSIRITGKPPSGIRKWNRASSDEHVTKLCRKDINWQHFDSNFDSKPRVQERQQVKDQQFK